MGKERIIKGTSYYKYQTSNSIYNLLVSNFKRMQRELLDGIYFTSVLEAGCGEGEVSNFIYCSYPIIDTFEAFDANPEVIDLARKSFPEINFKVESIYEQVYPENSFDLVVCCEVLEHLKDPKVALQSLFKVSRRYLLLSVPNEPLWRICNMFRGKYLRHLGNTPGHINHWSPRAFLDFTSNYGRVIKIKQPIPWTMVLLEKHATII